MKKIIINEKQKGFVFNKGKYEKTVGAGKYYVFGDKEIEVVDMANQVVSQKCDIETLLQDENLKNMVVTCDVNYEELVFHFEDGTFKHILSTKGKYAFWKDNKSHEFVREDISKPEVREDFPIYLFSKISPLLYSKVVVSQYSVGRLYVDYKFQKLLEPGTYYFWKNTKNVEVLLADTRLTRLDITGQEIMTQDKVALRINFVCNYKIKDYVKAFTEVDDYKECMHIACQLALREYVGKFKLDEILEKKDEMSLYITEKLKSKQDELYVEIKDAGVKDIILPGEIREIMNTVLVAEKKAQANVITRREEVASTRSLLNTAKLMEENQTLYKLKELEYVEKICENVGNITLNGNGDMLSQLLTMMGGKNTK